MTGPEIKRWRDQSGISQRELALKLEVSDSAVNRWENGQDIPGPVQLLLRMLIHGEMPFSGPDDKAEVEKLEAKHFWELKMSLADWHKMEGLASAGGFCTVRDYLLNLIHDHLNEEHENAMVAETAKPPAS